MKNIIRLEINKDDLDIKESKVLTLKNRQVQQFLNDLLELCYRHNFEYKYNFNNNEFSLKFVTDDNKIIYYLCSDTKRS